MQKYQPQQFEEKWSKDWDKNKTYKAPDLNKPSFAKASAGKQFIFPMFPYPSGAGLHVGHVRVYTGTDVIARFYRMNQYAVLHPMGWDAFGLPAENAAIKAKKNPMDMVPDHIATFKKQMKALGFSYDWDREFATTDPSYYKWTQWLFIQFYKMGLLYKKNAPINFCPFCKTGLSEEEVLSDGTHERCGNKIEKRDLPQWLFKITSYADRLLKDLEGLDWPKGILEMQKNWIGKKEGINITYKVINSKFQIPISKQISNSNNQNSKNEIIDEITCFTTRPDTNFGATFIVIAPEHEFVRKILNKEFEVDEQIYGQIKTYVETSKEKTELEREAEGRKKTGVFTGFYAINNLNNKPLAIWISDFVLMGFGTGAVVGVPGHDMRDFEFAKEFGIDIIRVVMGKDGDKSPITKKEQVQEENGIMINSGFLDGIEIHAAIKKIMDYLEEKSWGKRVATYHLRDWIFSRQRYWGEPIPMIFCPNCAKNQNTQNTRRVRKSEISEIQNNQNIRLSDSLNYRSPESSEFSEMPGWYPVPDSELPVKLPYVKSYEPTGTGESPLAAIKDWVNVNCPKCGGPARRETDTMPNWAGSCWYFIAFALWPQLGQLAPSIGNWKLEIGNSGNQWLPGDWYIGGAEHAVLHLLYARFWVKALYDLKLLYFKEPFLRLRNLGMILAEDHRKMSKSFGNVINPDDVQKEYGADALRVYEMFMAPFDKEISWSTKTLQGSYRFMTRIWKLFCQYGENHKKMDDRLQKADFPEDKKLVQKLYKTIKKVTADIPQVKFNTAVAAMMEFMNDFEKSVQVQSPMSNVQSLSSEHAKKFLQILAPFAPFATEEIWHEVFGEKQSIHLSNWPKIDVAEIKETELSIPVQVNGQVRTVLTVGAGETDEKSIVEKAINNEQVKKYVEGKKYKTIYVKGKILNLVV